MTLFMFVSQTTPRQQPSYILHLFDAEQYYKPALFGCSVPAHPTASITVKAT